MSARFSSAPFASWIATLAALGLAACQTFSPTFTPVPAPTLAVGDHWEYRITDNLRHGPRDDARGGRRYRSTRARRRCGWCTATRTDAPNRGPRVDANGGLIARRAEGRGTAALPDADPDVRLSAGAGQVRGGKPSRRSAPTRNSMRRFSCSATSRDRPWCTGTRRCVQHDVRLPHPAARRRAVLAHPHDAGRCGVVCTRSESAGA